LAEVIGFAPARQNLIPLYSAGLWLAVNMAGRSIAGGEPQLISARQPDVDHFDSAASTPSMNAPTIMVR
jgi:hypothetical protein